MRRAVPSKFVPTPKPEIRTVLRVHPKVFDPEDVVGKYYSIVKYNWKQWDVWLLNKSTGEKEYFLTRDSKTDAQKCVMGILTASLCSSDLTDDQRAALRKLQ